MFLLTRESRRWRRWTLLALVPLLGSYVWYAATGFPHGGSPMGLVYGALSLLLIGVLSFLGVRKRWYRSNLGTLESWTQSHVYLGLLVVVVILLHTGFRFEDRMAVAALVVLLLVVASGVAGVALYTIGPMLLSGVEGNTSLDEMSSQLNQQAKSMARLATGKSPAFERIYRDMARRTRPPRLAGWRILRRGRPRESADDEAAWEELLPQVSPAEGEDLKRILVLSRQNRELHHTLVLQQRYRNLLAIWLYLHLPLTFAMIVLVAAHIAAAIHYSEWLSSLQEILP